MIMNTYRRVKEKSIDDSGFQRVPDSRYQYWEDYLHDIYLKQFLKQIGTEQTW